MYWSLTFSLAPPVHACSMGILVSPKGQREFAGTTSSIGMIQDVASNIEIIRRNLNGPLRGVRSGPDFHARSLGTQAYSFDRRAVLGRIRAYNGI